MSPVICILNVANMAVSVIQDFPDMCAPAQAVWAPDDNGKSNDTLLANANKIYVMFE